MKYIKRVVWGVLILFFLTVIVSVETDFFVNIEHYIPAAAKYPVIMKLADNIDDMTDEIPSLSQIVESVKNKSLPVDPDDFAAGSYNSKSPMLNFYSDETLGVTLNDGKEICVFGVIKDSDRQNVLIVLTDKNGKELKRETTVTAAASDEFLKNIKIPKTDSDVVNVNVYTGEKSYGEFSSWAVDYIRIEKSGDSWQVKKSPVAEHNKQMYEQPKSLSAALKKTSAIRPDNEIIRSLAKQLTEGKENDYDKLFAIHEWVCGYLYYNIDYINSSKLAPFIDTEVFEERNVVCLGYSNLFASLCRSAGIPCYVVSGYALGIDSGATVWDSENYKTEEPNHAWNEAYVNNRWVIIDTTWDSFNRFEGGKRIKSEKNSKLYFDANPEFFSQNHKIIEYLED